MKPGGNQLPHRGGKSRPELETVNNLQPAENSRSAKSVAKVVSAASSTGFLMPRDIPLCRMIIHTQHFSSLASRRVVATCREGVMPTVTSLFVLNTKVMHGHYSRDECCPMESEPIAIIGCHEPFIERGHSC